MFGYYRQIKTKHYEKVLTIKDLSEIILSHPDKERILHLHALPYKCDDYSRLKAQLPCITPAGIFRNAKSKAELIQLSGYLYFDIDAHEIGGNLDGFKGDLIEQFKDSICLLGRSIGGRGLFYYVKVNGLTISNYESVYDYLQTTLFKELRTDTSCKNINRSQFIPFDPEVYTNLSSSTIEIPTEILNKSNKKRDTQCINNRDRCYTLSVPFLPINEVLKRIKWNSYEYEGDNLFDIDIIHHLRVYVPPKIDDGKKHSVFRGLVHALMYTTPEIDLLTLQSFINYVNENHTTKRMRRSEMLRTVENTYNHIVETGEIHVPTKQKLLHFNNQAALNGREKREVANKVNGLIKRYSSIKKIEDAKDELTASERKISRSAIAAITGLSLKTVSRNSEISLTEIAEQILALNYKIIASEDRNEKGTLNV